jgi:hypothetical protein
VIKLRGIGLGENVECIGKIRIMYKILIGKSRGNRPLESSRCRREDNIKVDFKVVGYKGIE